MKLALNLILMILATAFLSLLCGCQIYWLPLTADSESSIPDILKRAFTREKKHEPVDWSKFEDAHDCDCDERAQVENSRLRDDAFSKWQEAATQEEKKHWADVHERYAVEGTRLRTSYIDRILKGKE